VFSDALEKLQKKLAQEQISEKETAPVEPIPEPVEPEAVENETFDEFEDEDDDNNIDILAYMDSHKFVDEEISTIGTETAVPDKTAVSSQEDVEHPTYSGTTSKAFESLKEKLENSSQQSSSTAPLQNNQSESEQFESAEEESIIEEQVIEEEIDILAYVDSHGVPNKDTGESCIEEDEETEERVHEDAFLFEKRVNDEDFDFDEEGFSNSDNSDEILSHLNTHGVQYKASDLKKKKKPSNQNVTRSKLATEKQIDLHGMTSRDAELEIRAVFESAQRNGYQQILIVHGRGNHSTGGNPVLKRMVVDLLEGPLESQVASFYFAQPNEGGGGATRVVLR